MHDSQLDHHQSVHYSRWKSYDEPIQSKATYFEHRRKKKEKQNEKEETLFKRGKQKENKGINNEKREKRKKHGKKVKKKTKMKKKKKKIDKREKKGPNAVPLELAQTFDFYIRALIGNRETIEAKKEGF